MFTPQYFGILGGLIFGLVWVWQGAGAAFVVFAFVLLGWLIALGIKLVNRIASGEVERDAIRQLISIIFNGVRRG